MNKIELVRQFLSELSEWEMLAARLDDELEKLENEEIFHQKNEEYYELARSGLDKIFQTYATRKALKHSCSNLESQCYGRPPYHSAVEIVGAVQEKEGVAVLLMLPHASFPDWQRKYIVNKENNALKIDGMYVLYPKKRWVKEDF